MAQRLSIAFQTRSFPVTELLREQAQLWLEAGLASHRHRLGQVVVRVAGPRPGDSEGLLCAIHLDVLGHGPICTQSRAADLGEALNDAISRTRRRLDRVAQPGRPTAGSVH